MRVVDCPCVCHTYQEAVEGDSLDAITSRPTEFEAFTFHGSDNSTYCYCHAAIAGLLDSELLHGLTAAVTPFTPAGKQKRSLKVRSG